MNPYSETGHRVPSDEALLRRVQQDNQRQILSQLLHDLRNPIHSMRITIELFGRLARRAGDVDKLMERASTYIGPAEAALGSLVAINERLGIYLAAPSAPIAAPLPVNDWLSEIALLLKTSKRRLQTTCSITEDGKSWRLIADRARISHGVLQYCLGADSPRVTLSARANSPELIHIDVSFAPASAKEHDVAPPASGLTVEELRTLIENAGGTLANGAGADVSLSFPRSTG